ncbi:hypothetical protein C7477_11094 [Phyllobacterium leguminum]|uniref:Uncharacterized protein n=1 Tax=Phyllobacterium leguminum TaxID=314237 RepID=A0A318T205_9HYPH|nr:hypothetical protein C7477_11094 [Phyllobacterium leguminum]
MEALHSHSVLIEILIGKPGLDHAFGVFPFGIQKGQDYRVAVSALYDHMLPQLSLSLKSEAKGCSFGFDVAAVAAPFTTPDFQSFKGIAHQQIKRFRSASRSLKNWKEQNIADFNRPVFFVGLHQGDLAKQRG